METASDQVVRILDNLETEYCAILNTSTESKGDDIDLF